MKRGDLATGLDFSLYITERTRDFIGREWLFATIDRWLTDPDAPQIFLLAGEPGIGKTSIAARLTQFSAGTETPPADYAYVVADFLGAYHFCSARNGGWISPDGFTRSLSAQLAACYPAFADALASDPRIHIEQKAGIVSGTLIGAQITNYYAETSEALFNDLVRTPLQGLCSKNGFSTPLAILVDGLDESLNYSGRTNIVRLLAACWDLPAQVRLLLTSRPVDGVLEPFRPLQPFILYARSEENQGDVGAYVEHRFATSAALHDQAGDEAQVERVKDSLVVRSGGNFLVVSKVLDGVERGELSLDDPEALPADLQDLYAWFLDRLIQGDMRTWRELYRPVMGVLAVAQEPVDASTLCRWTSLMRQQVTDVLHDLREFLDPALDGRYRLYHESVVDFLAGDRAGPYTLNAAEYHCQVAASYVRRFLENGEAWTDCDVYGLRHLPLHFFAAEQTETLRGLLSDFDWLQAKLDATDVLALVADYEFLPGDAELRLVQRALRLSAHILAEDKTQLAGQLLGRLLSIEVPTIENLLRKAKRWTVMPWLRPLTSSLALPGSPLLHTLIGHTASVTAVAVLEPDAKHLVSASEDGTLKVWDLESGEELRTLMGHRGRVYAVVATPDGKQAISVAGDGKLKMWDLERGEELWTFPHTVERYAVAMTPNGQQIISVSSKDGYLKMWDLELREVLLILKGHCGLTFDSPYEIVWTLAVTPDGQWAISGSQDGTLKVWGLEYEQESREPVWMMPIRRELLTLTGHVGSVYAVAATPDGRQVVSGSVDSSLIVWDLERGEQVRTLTGHRSAVAAVAVLPHGQRVISGSGDGTIRVWDLECGRALYTLAELGMENQVNAVTVTQDGCRAISGSRDGIIRVWDLADEGQVQALTAHRNRVTAVALTQDGRQAVTTAFDGTLKVWAIAHENVRNTITFHTSLVRSVAVTADGRWAVSGGFDGMLKVWDLERGEELHALTGHKDEVTSIVVAPEGRQAISVSQDKSLKVWNLERGKELHTLIRHPHYSYGGPPIAVTGDGQWAVSASRFGTIEVWDLEHGMLLHTLVGHHDVVVAVAITADGRWAVSASRDRMIKVWDLKLAKEVHALAGHSHQITAVAAAGCVARAVSSAEDGTLRVWDLVRGEELHVLPCATGWGELRTAENGQRAVFASQDGTLRVYDIQAGRIIATFRGDGPLISCAIAPDGDRIVAGEMSGRVHFLRLVGV